MLWSSWLFSREILLEVANLIITHATHLQAAQAASKAEASAVAAAAQARKARTQGALAAANKAAQSYNQVCCKAGRR